MTIRPTVPSSLLASLDDFTSPALVPNSRAAQLKAQGAKIYPIYKVLSNSTLALLNTCPRKFQLEVETAQKRKIEQNAPQIEGVERVGRDTVDTAFGTAFGAGMQALWQTGDFELAVVVLLANWQMEFWDEKEKTRKSIPHCVRALQAYASQVYAVQRDEGWEIAKLVCDDGRIISGIEPACSITLAGGYRYDLHIDLVLYHPTRKQYKIVEVKTSGNNYFHEAMFANSRQALGYAAVIATKTVAKPKELLCEYLVYMTVGREFNTIEQVVNGHAIIQFFNDIICEANQIDNYVNMSYFPKRGTACMDYGKPCYYYGDCDYATRASFAGKDFYPEPIDVTVTLEDVLHHFNLIDSKEKTDYGIGQTN